MKVVRPKFCWFCGKRFRGNHHAELRDAKKVHVFVHKKCVDDSFRLHQLVPPIYIHEAP
jgi:hypothetical protein